MRNCWVLSFSAFALTDLKRFLKLRLWLANEEPPLVPFLVNIGARSSVGVDGVEAPEALLRLLSCCIKVLVVEADRTLAEEVVPILQGRRRKRAVSPLGPFEGGEKATLVVDVGVVADEDDAAPLDNEKYEGLSTAMVTSCTRNRCYPDALELFTNDRPDTTLSFFLEFFLSTSLNSLLVERIYRPRLILE